MLHFILGRASSGKTEYLHKKLGEILNGGRDSAVLIVPEQFTFETDKGILDTMGAENSNKVEVYSFTRLAEDVFERYGKVFKPVISDQGRLLYMFTALKALEEKLTVYKKQASNNAFVQSMLMFVDEIKQSSSMRDEIKNAILTLDDKLLKEKMKELLLICDTYDAIVSTSYLDTDDVLTKLYDVLCEEKYFEGKVVAIDGFSGFNGQIMRIIEKIMVQCDELYITLTSDGINYKETDSDIFAYTRRTANGLKNLALKNDVPVDKPFFVNEKTTGYNKYASEEIRVLEENFYIPDFEIQENKTQSIEIYCASSIEDECSYIARRIRELMNKGIRCREMSVVYRDESIYETEMKCAFKKYAVPMFEDSRQPILNQPLVIYVQNALKVCTNGFSTENILRFMKTGLTRLNVEEVSEIENYVYLWQIDSSQWKNDFVSSPYGFDENTPGDEEERLLYLNTLRKTVIEPLSALKEKISRKNVREITEAVYEFLIESEADVQLRELAVKLEEDGEIMLADEQNRIWDMLMEVFDELALALGDKYVDTGKYLELLNMSLSVKSLGRVPNGIDEVIIGQADRIKTRNNRIVFVAGLNSGVFPKENPSGGVLSDRDRNKLLKNGIRLFDTNKYKTVQERFISYNALCCAKEKLYLSYSTLKSKDGEKTKSEIVAMVENIFTNCKHVYNDCLPVEEYIVGKTAAFETLAKHFRENGYWSKNLMYYFMNDSEYSDKTETLKRVALNKDFSIKNKKLSLELFGKNMYLSASRIEEYENCPFKYFCKFGIGAKPKKTARLDPAQSGTLVHYVLEQLIKKYSITGQTDVSPQERRKDIHLALYEYAKEYMGGLSDRSERFIYHFERLEKIIDSILSRVTEEFKNSAFSPVEYELEIGTDGKISPYVVELPNGGSVRIFGYIDRVDEMKTEKHRYLRVVDYKTGKKELKLSDVMNGLNMQMLIYLMAITKNGTDYFGDNIVPSGVLYLPAMLSPFDAERNDNAEAILNAMRKEGRMNGLVLNDSRVVLGMDLTGEGIYIPAMIDSKTGKCKGKIISLEQLKNLNNQIDEIIGDMALQLQNGNIPAFPVSGIGHTNTCDYCDYNSVCCHSTNGKFRKIQSVRHEKCLEILDGGEKNEP